MTVEHHQFTDLCRTAREEDRRPVPTIARLELGDGRHVRITFTGDTGASALGYFAAVNSATNLLNARTVHLAWECIARHHHPAGGVIDRPCLVTATVRRGDRVPLTSIVPYSDTDGVIEWADDEIMATTDPFHRALVQIATDPPPWIFAPYLMVDGCGDQDLQRIVQQVCTAARMSAVVGVQRPMGLRP